jgi:hypothetical protein
MPTGENPYNEYAQWAFKAIEDRSLITNVHTPTYDFRSDQPQVLNSAQNPRSFVLAEDDKRLLSRLRDEFAMAALPTLIARTDPNMDSNRKSVAWQAYEIADAMLTARQQKKEE